MRCAAPDRRNAVDARMSAADTSIECLRRGNCLPVGGYSVVAAVGQGEVEMRRDDGVDGVADRRTFGIVGIVGIPGASGSGSGLGLPRLDGVLLVLVSSRLDASGLFHDATFGANAAMSGLVVMLAAAVRTRTRRDGAANSDVVRCNPAKPVVFAAFAAEAWGYAGSRRFAAELADDETANEEEPSSATSSPLPTWMRGASVDASTPSSVRLVSRVAGSRRRRLDPRRSRTSTRHPAPRDALVAALRRGADGRDLDVRRRDARAEPATAAGAFASSSLFSLVRRTPRVPGWSSPNTTARSSIRSTAARSTSDSPPWTSIEWHVSPRRSRRRSRIAREGGEARRTKEPIACACAWNSRRRRRRREKISRRRRRVPGVRRRGSRRRRTFDGVPDRSIRRVRVRDGEATVDDVRDVSVEVRRGGGGADERSRGAARENDVARFGVGMPSSASSRRSW